MTPKPEIVHMKDIAKAANVSLSTVSLSLRNSPLVKEATRLKVQKVADQLGYCTNPLLSALMRARRSHKNPDLCPSLALITGHDTRYGWKISETLREFHETACKRVAARGFHIEEIWRYEMGMTDQRLNGILEARGVRGLLLFPFGTPTPQLNLEWSNFATVAFGFSIGNHAFDRVGSDHYRAMCCAVRECHQLGYSRIAFVSLEHMSQRVDGRWLAGYLATLHELPSIERPRLFFPKSWNQSDIEAWFLTEQPDAIITSDPDIFTNWCDATGRSIPRDLGIVSLTVPSLEDSQSGIYQNPRLQAERAVDLLIDQIMRNQFGLAEAPMHCLIESTWVPGSTITKQ
jgi:LacI family transcriptional regulator